ncbi:hypothetical protein GW931_02760 [archaeon]|nr:hypothetical protein [archaeon]
MEHVQFLPSHIPRQDYVYVDGYTSGNPGPGGFIVTDHTGKILFKKHYNTPHTNNWYELGGIASATVKFPGKIIWSDSVTAIAWANGRMGKESRKLYANDASFQLMQSIILSKQPTIYKWNTELWGEIPADPGRKG